MLISSQPKMNIIYLSYLPLEERKDSVFIEGLAERMVSRCVKKLVTLFEILY